MTTDQMYGQINAMYKSLGMGDADINAKLLQFKALAANLPEVQAKKLLDEVIKTVAVKRSPSAGIVFTPHPVAQIAISAQVNHAAWDLQSTIVNLLKESGGRAHAESVVAVSSGIAGALLLVQHHGEELKKLRPGAAILSDLVNEGGTQLLEFFYNCEKQANIKTDTLKEIPQTHLPHPSHEEINSKFVPAAIAVCWRHELSPAQAPFAAIIATVLLIEHIKTILDPTIANAIVVRFLVFCSKTVPVLDI